MHQLLKVDLEQVRPDVSCKDPRLPSVDMQKIRGSSRSTVKIQQACVMEGVITVQLVPSGHSVGVSCCSSCSCRYYRSLVIPNKERRPG